VIGSPRLVWLDLPTYPHAHPCPPSHSVSSIPSPMLGYPRAYLDLLPALLPGLLCRTSTHCLPLHLRAPRLQPPPHFLGRRHLYCARMLPPHTFAPALWVRHGLVPPFNTHAHALPRLLTVPHAHRARTAPRHRAATTPCSMARFTGYGIYLSTTHPTARFSHYMRLAACRCLRRAV